MRPHPRNKKPLRKPSLRRDSGRPPRDRRQILGLAQQAALDCGAEALEWSLDPSFRLKLVLDREEPPPDTALLVAVLRRLRALLAQNELDPGALDIEVDTPGARRLLRTPRHFQRFAGRQIRVRRHGAGPDDDADAAAAAPSPRAAPRQKKDVLMTLLGERDGLALVRDAEGRERTLAPGDFVSIRLDA